MIDIELLWNILFAQIRGLIIEYASKKLKKLTKKLDTAGVNEHIHTGDKDWQLKVKGWRRELKDIREDKLRGSLVRSRAQYVDMIEKPSKFYLKLENKSFV